MRSKLLAPKGSHLSNRTPAGRALRRKFLNDMPLPREDMRFQLVASSKSTPRVLARHSKAMVLTVF